MLKKYKLWKQYMPVYFRILNNPIAKKAMYNDPGVRFMRHGWYIVLFIILLLSTASHWIH